MKKHCISAALFLLLVHPLVASGLVAVIQPKLTEQDYRTAVIFQSALEPYFQDVQAKRSPHEAALVVLPEYVGTWLVASGEGKRVFHAQNEEQAMTWIILHHPFRFLKTLLSSLLCSDFDGSFMGHVKRAIFLLRAEAIRTSYQAVFSELAQTHQCWIVAGSTILPECEIADGQIRFLNTHKLMNQSFVFNPEGAVELISKKIYPLEGELEFLDAASPDSLRTVDTELGRLGVLVCADSWYPDPYLVLKSQGVDIIAVPSFVTPAELWNSAWNGYNPAGNEPEDVDMVDVGQHLEKDMWEKYAVCGRIEISGAELGMNSFLVGSFWGLTGAGQSTIAIPEGIVTQAPYSTGNNILYYHFSP